MSYLKKIQSRKFQLALGAVLVAIGAALQGQIDWDIAMRAIVSVVLIYNGVEGGLDAIRAKNEKES